MVVQILLTGRGTFKGNVLAHYNVHVHEFIAHCLLATTDECACPAQWRTNALAAMPFVFSVSNSALFQKQCLQ